MFVDFARGGARGGISQNSCTVCKPQWLVISANFSLCTHHLLMADPSTYAPNYSIKSIIRNYCSVLPVIAPGQVCIIPMTRAKETINNLGSFTNDVDSHGPGPCHDACYGACFRSIVQSSTWFAAIGSAWLWNALWNVLWNHGTYYLGMKHVNISTSCLIYQRHAHMTLFLLVFDKTILRLNRNENVHFFYRKNDPCSRSILLTKSEFFSVFSEYFSHHFTPFSRHSLNQLQYLRIIYHFVRQKNVHVSFQFTLYITLPLQHFRLDYFKHPPQLR